MHRTPYRHFIRASLAAGICLALSACAPESTDNRADVSTELPVSAASSALPILASDTILNTISFGSCAKEREPQPLWDQIATGNPDVFLFIGDNQYADLYYKGDEMVMAPVETAARIQEAYDDLAKIPEFAAFRASVPMLGTWDDHDYGANDYGKEFEFREESQQLFLDFFGVPKDDPRREREGVYSSQIVGPEGKRVQLIMLDTRYHRDAMTPRPGGYDPVKAVGPYLQENSDDATVLGDAQWAWLEEQLRQPADVRIISSSIQLVAHEHGWESWGNFPAERQRMYDLIAQTKANGVVFLSGDRHLMEISKDTGQLGNAVPYPMWDFTSSGINQSFGEVRDPNTFRVGPVMRLTNFGEVRLQWGDTLEDTHIHFVGLDENRELLTEAKISLAELQVKG